MTAPPCLQRAAIHPHTRRVCARSRHCVQTLWPRTERTAPVLQRVSRGKVEGLGGAPHGVGVGRRTKLHALGRLEVAERRVAEEVDGLPKANLRGHPELDRAHWREKAKRWECT